MDGAEPPQQPQDEGDIGFPGFSPPGVDARSSPTSSLDAVTPEALRSSSAELHPTPSLRRWLSGASDSFRRRGEAAAAQQQQQQDHDEPGNPRSQHEEVPGAGSLFLVNPTNPRDAAPAAVNLFAAGAAPAAPLEHLYQQPAEQQPQQQYDQPSLQYDPPPRQPASLQQPAPPPRQQPPLGPKQLAAREAQQPDAAAPVGEPSKTTHETPKRGKREKRRKPESEDGDADGPEEAQRPRQASGGGGGGSTVYALVVLAGVAAAAAGFALWWRKRGAGQEGAQTGSSAQKPGAKGLDAELDAFDAEMAAMDAEMAAMEVEDVPPPPPRRPAAPAKPAVAQGGPKAPQAAAAAARPQVAVPVDDIDVRDLGDDDVDLDEAALAEVEAELAALEEEEGDDAPVAGAA
ncbi:hypothetical protein MNEG_5211 [Monoraphidium neglectum]|uniref:Uncharacterized protein n=1 Tax=Monoraphidium neglectum TaxID=145388 RepID=A0A0D2MI93_9CHLO|nr:hypothetical protein MNEG_5211 [Monoraphidium neglectum]KIZ02745.1 hypothetical protein MNEG_5211 [Monoraphidium neglectum]|eukprot:XP_013901764.1 hypothetical protein MNEG_5211 [Monoraphidium neglectum]